MLKTSLRHVLKTNKCLLGIYKIYNRTNTFGIKRKNNFDFNFQLWRRKKIQKNATLAKNSANYKNRVVEKNEQQPVDIFLDENQTILFAYEWYWNHFEKTNCKK